MKKGTLILFRTDASDEIGPQYVERCRVLAARLKSSGAKVAFACRGLGQDMMAQLKKDGHKVFDIDEQAMMMTSIEDDADATVAAMESSGFDADWIVVDHPSLDSLWENRVRVDRNVLVIDNSADRSHDCDVLVDFTSSEDAEQRYEDLVPSSARLLLGPEYSLTGEGAEKIVKAMSERKRAA